MVQFAVWSALANEGIGASLQHYNELIEDEVKKTFALEKKWKLISQMPFGKVAANASEKEFILESTLLTKA
jgi:predicted oxidoreductase (fatty acid repression mutant protein)